MQVQQILLASRDQTLAQSVRRVVDPFELLRLEVVCDVREASRLLDRLPSVSLCILHMLKGDELEDISHVIETGRKQEREVQTIVIFDEPDAERELTLLRARVAECLSRPLDLRRLAYLVELLGTVQQFRTHRPFPDLTNSPIEQLGTGNTPFLISRQGPFGRLADLIRRVSPLETTVFLAGETGTGKTSLAKTIHSLSPRFNCPFVTLNCGCLSPGLIESELFGHVRGAFTGTAGDRDGKCAAAGSGTLFLDEIDALPLELQPRLLRIIEERVFEPVGSNTTRTLEARLLVASNRPLHEEVAAGRFRSDLFYRINVVTLELPPLRDVKDLIPSLAHRFLHDFSRRADRHIAGFESDALAALVQHSWPGNIRELRNAIERAMVMGEGDRIRLTDLPETLNVRDRTNSPGPPRGLEEPPRILPTPLVSPPSEGMEQQRILRALEMHAGNRLRAAAELGISRMTLYNRMRRFGLIGSSEFNVPIKCNR